MVLDVHPEPEHVNVHVRSTRDSEFEAAGIGHRESGALDDIVSSRADLDAFIGAGHFAFERELMFEMNRYFDAPTEWHEWLAREKIGRPAIDVGLVDSALAAMAEGNGSIRLRYPVRAWRLRNGR